MMSTLWPSVRVRGHGSGAVMSTLWPSVRVRGHGSGALMIGFPVKQSAYIVVMSTLCSEVMVQCIPKVNRVSSEITSRWAA